MSMTAWLTSISVWSAFSKGTLFVGLYSAIKKLFNPTLLLVLVVLVVMRYFAALSLLAEAVE